MAEEALLQIRCYFGVIELITETHDIPRGVAPKYTISVEGEGYTFEPHFVAPPRSYFFLSPGEYTIKVQFLGVVAEPVTILLQTGDVYRAKYHFHGRWMEGLPKPPIAVPRAKRPQPVQQAPAYAPPAGYAPPGAAYPPPAAAAYTPPPPAAAFAPTPQPPGPQSPAYPAMPQPAAPAAAVAPASTMPSFTQIGASATIAPPPMPTPTHMVAPPPPPPGRPGGAPGIPPPSGGGWPGPPR